MTVRELIEELNKCNPDDVVIYDFENSYHNDLYQRSRFNSPWDCGVDDIIICDGMVLLTEKINEE